MNILLRKRIVKALLLIILAFTIGTIGFHFLLDGLTLIDSFYLTVVTLATVGYGDFTPHTNMPTEGNPYIIKFFAIFIILFGMSALLYGIGIMTEYIVSGEMLRERRLKRMRKLISALHGHYIICGGGETSVYMMQELEKTARSFVVIEKSEERIQELFQQFENLLYVKGDATHDEVIQQAGLDKAVGVIAALPDEKDNLLVAMSLSQKKKDSGNHFRIGAKVTHLEKMAPKLRSAGANYVISPQYISSRRMVSEMFRPTVTTFLDRMLKDLREVMRFEEVTIASGSAIAGKTLKESNISEKTGLSIIAVRKGGTGGFIYNPGPEQTIEADDVLITMGAIHNIIALRKLSHRK